jgi:RNA polymerase sigma factor (sigma-70 family)
MGHDEDGEFEEVLQRTYRYALSLSHDRTVAEDLVQEACLRVARRGGPWAVAYLMRVVRNAYVDRQRHEAVLRIGSIDGAAEPVAVPERSDEVSDELSRALAGLSADEREALYLSAVGEHSAAEIARMTGRPRGTVLSLLYRGKEKVRRLLGSGGERLSI